METPAGVAADFDSTIKRQNLRALRLQFDGTQNLGDLRISQTTYLPAGRYRFRAYIRTEEISTDEGISIRVTFEDAPKQLDFMGGGLRGSNDWTLVEHRFALAASGLVRVSLARKPSFRFDNLIKGTMWMDQASIEPE